MSNGVGRNVSLQGSQRGTGRRQAALGAAAAGALVAVPRPSRAARGITIAGLGDWFQARFDPIVLAPFRKAHPDIDVFYYPTGNSFQTLALLRTERLYPSVDVVLLESSVAMRATAEGLLDRLDLPVLKDLDPAAVLAKSAGPVMAWDSLALGFNPGLVPAPPRAWRALWNTAYARIALQTPPDPAALALIQVAGTLFGGSGDQQALDIGLTALAPLARRVTVWDPNPDIYTVIAFGDAAIGPGWNARAQDQAARTPGRFAAVLPDEGSPVLSLTVNVVKGIGRVDAARTLAGWLVGPEAQRLLAETMAFAPVNPNADIPAATLARVGGTSEMTARRMPMDWATITAIRDQITAEWRRRTLVGR